jgi:hypothetical protein
MTPLCSCTAAMLSAGTGADPQLLLVSPFMTPPPTLRVVTGTLLIPRERTADVYLRYGAKYGVTLTEAEVLERFRW